MTGPGRGRAEAQQPDTPRALAVPRWRRWLLPEWAGRNVHLVLATRLCMSAARALAGVVTVLYLAAEGFSGIELGLLFVAVTLASALMATGVGMLSDRFGRKRFLVTIPLLSAVAAVVYAEVRVPAVLFLFAAVGSFGRGMGAGGGSDIGPYQPAESAYIGEAVKAEHRSAAFGRLATASVLGGLGGSLLAGLARVPAHVGPLAATAAYRPAFFATAVLAALGGLLALGLQEPPRTVHHAAPGRFQWPRESWPALWRFWVTNGVNGVATGAIGPFMSYWFHRRFAVSPGTIGVLFAIVNFGSLLSTVSAAAIARRVGTVRVISLVRALGGAILIPMVLAPSFALAGLLYFVRMIVMRLGMPLRQSFNQDMADPAERARMAALSNLPAQATMAGSQVFVGYLFQDVGLSAPFELAAGFQVLNAALYVVLFSWRPPPAPVPAGAPSVLPSQAAPDL